MVIPELKNYNGCKGGNGVYQQIISIIPPHDILVVPFLGHCGISRNIKPCNILIGVDASEKVINAWKNYLLNTLNYKKEPSDYSFLKNEHCFVKTKKSTGDLPNIIYLFKDDAFIFLETKLVFLTPLFNDARVTIYLDPPYPFFIRKSKAKIYDFEFTDNQHSELLSIITKMTDQNIIISSYKNKMYNNALRDWNTHSFSVGTRNGKAIETVYYNYDLNKGLLHDYRYLGNNFKDRERIKLKISRWTNRLGLLDTRERMAIMEALKTKIQ